MSQNITVTITAERPGVVTVASPGERMRIVAAPEQIATAAGQRVAGLVNEALRLLDGAPDVPPEPGDEIPAEWEAAVRSGSRLAMPITSLTEAQIARILASAPDDGGPAST